MLNDELLIFYRSAFWGEFNWFPLIEGVLDYVYGKEVQGNEEGYEARNWKHRATFKTDISL